LLAVHVDRSDAAWLELAGKHGGAGDGASFRQAALWLSDEELDQLQARLTEAFEPFLEHRDAPGRTRRILSTTFISDP
jgi:hypothetical protein